jgi:hypothetical protein
VGRRKVWKPTAAQLEALQVLTTSDGRYSNRTVYRGYSGPRPWIHWRTADHLVANRAAVLLPGNIIRITDTGRRWLNRGVPLA